LNQTGAGTITVGNNNTLTVTGSADAPFGAPSRPVQGVLVISRAGIRPSADRRHGLPEWYVESMPWSR